MGKTRGKKKLTQPTLAESKGVIGLAVGLLLLISGMIFLAAQRQPALSRRPDSPQIPVYVARAEDAKPFPGTLDPAQFTMSGIREAYSVAKEIPDVLVQQPCYCYCQRQGHRSLLDCFTSSHATRCDICIQEARLAGKLHRQGKTAEQIRAAINQKQWANLGGSR